jgi:hypothetical protein
MIIAITTTTRTISEILVNMLMARMDDSCVNMIFLLSLIFSIVTEHLGQQILNPVVLIQLGSIENVVQLTRIEPQAVAPAALIYEQSRLRIANDNLLHLLVADGAFPLRFLGLRIDPERAEQCSGLFRLIKQEFEFAGIKPDSATVKTVVNLNILELKCDHRILTNRTIHNA